MNKLYCFLTCFIFSALISTGQSSIYHPFADSGAIWREFRFGGDGGFYHYEWEEEKYIKGDTTIAANVYHKVYESGLFTQYLISTYDTSYYYYENYIACFREDTNKRVYIFTSQEDLLYDFNLNTGDTLPNGFNYQLSQGDTVIISSIDSVFDGTNYRKRFNLSTTTLQNYTSIIEGIGSTYGLFTLLNPPFESGGILRCYIENDTSRYDDGSFNACEIINHVKHEKEKLIISISPNPVKFYTVFSLNGVHPTFDITISNSVGQVIRSERCITSKNYFFDRNGLNHGVYFYDIYTNLNHVRGILILI